MVVAEVAAAAGVNTLPMATPRPDPAVIAPELVMPTANVTVAADAVAGTAATKIPSPPAPTAPMVPTLVRPLALELLSVNALVLATVARMLPAFVTAPWSNELLVTCTPDFVTLPAGVTMTLLPLPFAGTFWLLIVTTAVPVLTTICAWAGAVSHAPAAASKATVELVARRSATRRVRRPALDLVIAPCPSSVSRPLRQSPPESCRPRTKLLLVQYHEQNAPTTAPCS